MGNESWVSVGILIATSLSFFVALIALILQFRDSKRQKEKDETPILKVYIQRREKHNGFGNNINCYAACSFVVKNVGPCGVTILECLIGDKPIIEFNQELTKPEIIIGAFLETHDFVSCPINRSRTSQVSAGSNVKLVCKSVFGKTFRKLITLSEE